MGRRVRGTSKVRRYCVSFSSDSPVHTVSTSETDDPLHAPCAATAPTQNFACPSFPRGVGESIVGFATIAPKRPETVTLLPPGTNTFGWSVSVITCFGV